MASDTQINRPAAMANRLATTANRHRLLRIRVLPDELARWRAAAEQQGSQNLSGWLRALADQAAACGEDPRAWRRDLARLSRDLNAGLGNNLNQIARALAAEDADAATAEHLARLASELGGLRRAVTAHLRGSNPSHRRTGAKPASKGEAP